MSKKNTKKTSKKVKEPGKAVEVVMNTATIPPTTHSLNAAHRGLTKWLFGVLLVAIVIGIVGTFLSKDNILVDRNVRMTKQTIPLLHQEWREFLCMTDIVRRVKFRDPRYRSMLKSRCLKSPNPSNQFIANEYPQWFTEDMPPRVLNVPGILNFRDMGGWKTEDGTKRIRQGFIYRSGELNGKTYYGQMGPNFVTIHNRDIMIRDLGIRTDIDLRWNTETDGMTGSPLGPTVEWQHYPWSLYQWIGNGAEMQMFHSIFKELCNRDKLPALVHCVYGKDRTGTLCFILEGILGVSDDDKLKDWEASAFYFNDGNFIHVKGIDGLIEYLSRTYQKPTLNENCVAYAKACGAKDEDLELFRSIMLEEVR